MGSILLAIGILTALGLIFGVVLAFASAALAVPEDEKVQKLREALPSINCGRAGIPAATDMPRRWPCGLSKAGALHPEGRRSRI